jgi:hypothetical protein
MLFDWDDFGSNHVISDQCQSRDCRAELDRLHYANPAFRCTLFAIPYEMTAELVEWCQANKGWVDLAIHGLRHSDNYEASQWSQQEAEAALDWVEQTFPGVFVKGFKAPGWQISDGVYQALKQKGYWVADQGYNFERIPEGLKAYINKNDEFFSYEGTHESFWVAEKAWHGHVWNCCGNGIEETFEHVEQLVRTATEFKTINEVLA